MKATHLLSPAHTSLLEFKPSGASGWDAVICNWNGGLPLTETMLYQMTDGDAANLRARLIHRGWTEK